MTRYPIASGVVRGFLIFIAAAFGGGCSVPIAKLQTPDPIGTTYWGKSVDGLCAGIAIDKPGGGQVGPSWQAPGIRIAYKLKNTSDHAIKVIRAQIYRLRVDRASTNWQQEWPDSNWMPTMQQVVELSPGAEVTSTWDYDPGLQERTPYDRTLQFEYLNYAQSALLRDDHDVPTTVQGIWTGHLRSGALSVKVH